MTKVVKNGDLAPKTGLILREARGGGWAKYSKKW